MAKVEKSDSYITAKKNAADRRREKIKQVDALFKGGEEPKINPLDYSLTLIRFLNWHNINTELKDIRGYLNAYLSSTNRNNFILVLNKVPDIDIKHIGLLSNLKLSNQYISPEHETLLESRISELLEQVYETVAPVQEVKVKVDRTYEQSIIFSEAIEEAIDEFVTKKKTTFIPLEYIKSNEVPTPVCKKIGDYYSKVLKELSEAYAGTDEQLVEGYSNFTKAQLKKFIAFVESIVSACTQQVQSLKVRKPRKTKPVSPLKLTAKVKYAKEYEPLKLKSVQVSGIVGASEVWTYNTKYRKLAIYKNETGNKLTVKGTSILGFDVTESKQVMLRKPDEFFSNLIINKKALTTGFKTLKTKSVTPNGRLNKDTIILGVF